MKTQAWAGYALQKGVPAASLGVAGNFINDMSTQGMLDAYLDPTTTVMHKEQDFFSRHSLSDRLTYSRLGEVGRENGEIIYENGRFSSLKIQETPGVRINGTKHNHMSSWWVPETAFPAQFSNHFALLVNASKNGRDSQLMVIDPAYNRHEPITISDWKYWQNNQDSVVVLAGLRTPFHIDSTTLSNHNLMRLKGLLGMESSSDDAVVQRLKTLDTSQRNILMVDFFSLSHDDRKTLRSGSRDHPLERYSFSMRHRLTRPEGLFRPNLHFQGSLNACINALSPLTSYQGWLIETDTMLRLVNAAAMARWRRSAAVSGEPGHQSERARDSKGRSHPHFGKDPGLEP